MSARELPGVPPAALTIPSAAGTLRARGLRLTEPRRIILEMVRATDAHPSASMVYRTVRRRLPRVSLATVYRNLRRLAAEGLPPRARRRRRPALRRQHRPSRSLHLPRLPPHLRRAGRRRRRGARPRGGRTGFEVWIIASSSTVAAPPVAGAAGRASASTTSLTRRRSPWQGRASRARKSHENLKEAFAGESQANRRYLYFARVADIEGFPGHRGPLQGHGRRRDRARVRPPRLPEAGRRPGDRRADRQHGEEPQGGGRGRDLRVHADVPGHRQDGARGGLRRDRRVVRDAGQGREVARRPLHQGAARRSRARSRPRRSERARGGRPATPGAAGPPRGRRSVDLATPHDAHRHARHQRSPDVLGASDDGSTASCAASSTSATAAGAACRSARRSR